MKSREICRGFAIYQNRVVHLESHLELMVFFMLALRPQTLTIEEQPPAVTYWDGASFRHHTFDFRVINRDESWEYVGVKPAALVVSSGIKTIFRQIAEQLPPGTAKAVHLVTDADFSYADRYNATMAFDFLRFPVAEHDEAITRLAAEMIGTVRIADLVKASGLGAMGFRSIIRLIVSQVLVQVKRDERITYDTYVRTGVRPTEASTN
ncbi:hypothetical protein [Tardiphaga sp. 285_C5_N1_2]|uniref:hypothetical protein n=1 Tax=Tardiphaga sp. 285_C5_N1_2 TaxID=3240775 RepID=UPI003F8C903F